MCGIWCCISSVESSEVKCPICVSETDDFKSSPTNCQREFISRRGPDVSHSRCLVLESPQENTEPAETKSPSNTLRIHLESHVLWTQGEKAYQQPLSNEEDSKFMLYNGDIYSFTGSSETETVFSTSTSSNDGHTLFRLLEQCSNNEEEICRVLKNLEGPFAFIFVDQLSMKLWFARDFFGRESLIFSYDDAENNCDTVRSWSISSVSVYKNVVEVPTSGLFSVDLRTKELKRFAYSHPRKNVFELETDFVTAVKNSGFISYANINLEAIKIDLHFDCKLKVPESEDIASQNDILLSLINIATEHGNVSNGGFVKKSVATLSRHINAFVSCLRKSVRRRVSVLPPYCKNCLLLCDNVQVSNRIICDHSKVGVLFSGGLDSTVLAYLAAEELPEGSTLDLINVAFSKDENFNNVPDRKTALASYKMLKEKFSLQGKKINLVLVNVNKPEVEEQRYKRIKYLIAPLKSVLDDSIGVCLWFAARGKGYLYDPAHPLQNDYTSPIRVVLLGSGADELLGGYGRHRSAFENSGWMGLASEMQLEIDRISIRNLGRDNRIVSDHGICPRMPFLDEQVVDFLTTQCDLWVKCCPVNAGPLGSRGSGEKLLLRAVGATLFGDSYLSLALFPKCAMQFGSRIAKLENSKEKGGDACQRLH